MRRIRETHAQRRGRLDARTLGGVGDPLSLLTAQRRISRPQERSARRYATEARHLRESLNAHAPKGRRLIGEDRRRVGHRIRRIDGAISAEVGPRGLTEVRTALIEGLHSVDFDIVESAVKALHNQMERER